MPEETKWLPGGITEKLTIKLNHLSALRVTPWQSASRYSVRDQDPKDIASELNVEALVVGTIMMFEGRISGSVSVIDARDGSLFSSTEFDEPSTEKEKINFLD